MMPPSASRRISAGARAFGRDGDEQRLDAGRRGPARHPPRSSAGSAPGHARPCGPATGTALRDGCRQYRAPSAAIASRAARDRRRMPSRPVGDEGRQHRRRAVAAHGPRQRRDERVGLGRRVEQHAAAAIDLRIDEAGRQHAAAELDDRACEGMSATGTMRRDAPSADQGGWPSSESFAGEDPGAGEGRAVAIRASPSPCAAWSACRDRGRVPARRARRRRRRTVSIAKGSSERIAAWRKRQRRCRPRRLGDEDLAARRRRGASTASPIDGMAASRGRKRQHGKALRRPAAAARASPRRAAKASACSTAVSLNFSAASLAIGEDGPRPRI